MLAVTIIIADISSIVPTIACKSRHIELRIVGWSVLGISQHLGHSHSSNWHTIHHGLNRIVHHWVNLTEIHAWLAIAHRLDLLEWHLRHGWRLGHSLPRWCYVPLRCLWRWCHPHFSLLLSEWLMRLAYHLAEEFVEFVIADGSTLIRIDNLKDIRHLVLSEREFHPFHQNHKIVFFQIVISKPIKLSKEAMQGHILFLEPRS